MWVFVDATWGVVDIAWKATHRQLSNAFLEYTYIHSIGIFIYTTTSQKSLPLYMCYLLSQCGILLRLVSYAMA